MVSTILSQVSPNQGLQLVKINQNPGVLPVKLGRAFIQQDKWSIIKIISLEGIVKDLNYNVEKYSEFNDIVNQNKSYINEISDLKTQVEYLRDETVNKVRQLIPSKRIKRGIINPLGSIIKVITGNLDHDDAIRYDKIISELKTQGQGLANKITLVSEMMDHFLNSTQIMDSNAKIMNERLQRIENTVKDLSKENMYTFISYLNSVLNMFIVNFRTLYIKVNELETALALSKVSVLHKSVIEPNELLSLLSEITKYGNLMYPVSEKYLINIEETLSLKTYINNDEIRFIMEIPLTNNISYNYFKLYPLPMTRDLLTVVIIPEFPFLLVEGTVYRPTATQCREITSNEYLCSEDDLVPYATTTCIEQLMEYRSNQSMCFPRTVVTEDLKLQKITSSDWIAYSKCEKMLIQTCGKDVIREVLLGTYILTLAEYCDVTIDGVALHGRHHHQIVTADRPVPLITLPDVQKLRQSHVVAEAETVDLKGVNLDDVQHLNYVLKSVKSEKEQYSVTKSVSVATIVLYIIIGLCVSYIISVKIKKISIERRERAQVQQAYNRQEDQFQPPVLLMSG